MKLHGEGIKVGGRLSGKLTDAWSPGGGAVSGGFFFFGIFGECPYLSVLGAPLEYACMCAGAPLEYALTYMFLQLL